MRYIRKLGTMTVILCVSIVIGACSMTKANTNNNTQQKSDVVSNNTVIECLTKNEKISDFSMLDYMPSIGDYKTATKEDNGTYTDVFFRMYYSEYDNLCYQQHLYGRNGMASESEFSTIGYILYEEESNALIDRCLDYYENPKTDVWLIPLGKEYHGMHIEPYFYTVDTRNNSFENCILTVTKSDENDTTICAYAPYNGRILEITLDPNGEIWSWSETERIIYDDVSQTMPDDNMIVWDILDDTATELWMNGNDSSALTLAMRWEENFKHLYIFTETYDIIYSGMIDETPDGIYVMGDPGCREAQLFYLSEGELEIIIGEDTYTFYQL